MNKLNRRNFLKFIGGLSAAVPLIGRVKKEDEIKFYNSTADWTIENCYIHEKWDEGIISLHMNKDGYIETRTVNTVYYFDFPTNRWRKKFF